MSGKFYSLLGTHYLLLIKEVMMQFKTYTPTAEDIDSGRAWWVVDATDMNVGRLAARVAAILRGKHKPTFAPHIDTGDFVIVINAEKISASNKRLDSEFYYRHSLYPGGFRQTSMRDMLKRHP